MLNSDWSIISILSLLHVELGHHVQIVIQHRLRFGVETQMAILYAMHVDSIINFMGYVLKREKD